MNNALIILNNLDEALTADVELTVYGRAALQLGFDNPLADFAVSRDVDAVLFVGQAEQLNEETNFWTAVEQINRNLADQELYISHFFVEDQVILSPDWRNKRCIIEGDWKHLNLFRLGNSDLLLSKLMRNDPIDHNDAMFIVDRAGFSSSDIQEILDSARIPGIQEIMDEFRLASQKILSAVATR